MNLLAIRLLLPCHSLDDFPTFHEGEDAENLLVTWTCPWHPAFLAKLQKLPEWNRVENVPDSCQDQVFLAPNVSQARLPSGFRQRCEEQAGFLVDVPTDRTQAVAKLAAVTDLHATVTQIPASLAQDFFSLSYTYLQVELLTRQLRYTSNLDTAHFESQVIKAATAAVQGDAETTELALERCFDLLSEERHRYYPMPSYLCDLTLLAPTTLGPSSLGEAIGSYPANWLATSELLQQIERQSPEFWPEVVQAVTDRRVLIATAGYSHAPTGLLSHETLRRNLAWSQEHSVRVFSQPSRVFARRLPGLEVTLPAHLKQFGFQAALHEAFQETRLPQASHTYLRWQGPDGETIPGLAKTIYDANNPNTFLKLGIRIGETLDVDHVSASQFVHWPGQASAAYQDLVRSAIRCDALGKWCLLDELMSQLNDPGYSPNLSSFDYRAGYLKHLVATIPHESGPGESGPGESGPRDSAASESAASESAADPIQQVRQCVHREHQSRQVTLWSGLAQLAAGHRRTESLTVHGHPVAASARQVANGGADDDFIKQWQALLPATEAELTELRNQLQAQVVQALTTSGSENRIVLNSEPQVRRVLLEPADWKGCDPSSLPADQVYAAHRDRKGWWAIVDVPPLGYLHLPKTPTTSRGKVRQPRIKVASGKSDLRNEFLSASIDPQTGSLRSIHDYQSRSNLCSLQLAWFDQSLASAIGKLLKSTAQLDWKQSLAQLLGNRESDSLRRTLLPYAQGYSTMKAKRIEVVVNNPVVGHIRAEGHLILLDVPIAKYVLDYRLELGSRFLVVSCQIQPTIKDKQIALDEEVSYQFPPTDQTTGSGFRRYFAWRFAQAHPSAELFRDLNSMKHEATRPTTEAPKLLQFQNVDQSIALLTDGLAFHRFPADGKSDTLIGLSPAAWTNGGLTAKIAIGLSPKNGVNAAEHFLASPPVVPCGPLRTGLPPAAWMFRCSSSQILVTHWENRYQDGRWIGVQMRMIETAGRSRKFKLEFAGRPAAVRAHVPQWADELLRATTPKVRLEGDVVECSVSPFEQLELEVDFPEAP